MLLNVYKKNILVSIFLIFCSSLYGQIPVVNHLTVNDGLPNSTIKTILQDNIGFVWFGTKNGLVRYDGAKYDVFLPDARDVNALPDGYISSLTQGSDDDIYIGTYSGVLCKYDYSKNKISQIFSVDTILEKGHLPISKIVEYSAGKYACAVLGGGIILYDVLNSTMQRLMIVDPDGKEHLFVSDLVLDSSGNIWAAADGEYVYQWLSDWKSFKTIKIPVLPDYQFVSFGNKLFVDEFHVYIGTEQDGCFVAEIGAREFTHISQTKGMHVTALQKGNNKIIIGTDGDGLLFYDNQTHVLEQYKYSDEDLYSLSTNAIWSLAVSNNQTLWIGTFARGVDYVSLESKLFENYRYIGESKKSVSAPSVLGIVQDRRGRVWFATDGGGVDLMVADDEFRNYNTINSSLQSNVIKCIYEDSSGLLWFGSYANGVSFIDEIGYEEHIVIVDKLRNTSIWDIAQDKNGVYWFASLYKGLFSYNSVTKKIRHFTHDPQNRFSIGSNMLYALFIDGADNLWVASDGGGLLMFDRKNEIFINHTFDVDRPSSIGSNSIRSICQTNDGSLWIGTVNGGLCKLLDEQKSVFKQFSLHDGLVSNTINGIVAESENTLWLSSDKGIMCFNTEDYSVKSFGVDDGLQGLEFNDQSVMKAKDGKLYFGGLNGFNVLNSKDKYESAGDLNVVIRSVNIGNKNVIEEEEIVKRYKNATNVFELDELRLSKDVRAFSVDFSFFNYSNISSYKISYKLEGKKKVNWIELDKNQTRVEFGNLSGGKFVLKYKLSNNGDDSEIKELKVNVEKTLWERPAFYILLFVLFLALVAIVFITIVRIKNQRAILLEEKIEERTKLIKKQNEELILQRDSLRLSNSKILMQKQELQESHEEMNVQNEELRTKSELLKEVNDEITEQSEKISEQALKLKEKNTLITKSLNYARRIQNTVFPSENHFREYLPNSFVFFRAKDIVSGDFYWIRKVDELIVFAEVDCTGHGVPGAFMSMIGNILLNEIILNRRIVRPDEIFYELNRKLLEIFSLGEFDMEAQDDGMDLTLGVYNESTQKLQISSAMQNFYVVKDGDIRACKGDIFSIGGLMARYKNPVYTLHQFDVESGTRVYFSSDGYIDQFGGEERAKYGVERFEKQLVRLSDIKITNQKELVHEKFDEWIGENDQLDDVLVIGVEF